ncbi:MAG: hypothetical protein ABI210_07105 [Abditibacteriaceae bacterium]
MFLNPDANISSSLIPQVQANYNDLGDGAKSYGLYGAYSLGGKTEIGAGIGHYNGDGNLRSGFAANIKQSLIGVPGVGTHVAYGIGYDGIHFANLYTYLAGTQNFGSKLTGHGLSATLGLRWDRFGKEIDSTKTSVYGGMDFQLSDKLHLIGELQSRNTKYDSPSPYAIGIRYSAFHGITLGAGLQRTGWDGDSGRLFAQVGYKFGG